MAVACVVLNFATFSSKTWTLIVGCFTSAREKAGRTGMFLWQIYKSVALRNTLQQKTLLFGALPAMTGKGIPLHYPPREYNGSYGKHASTAESKKRSPLIV